MLDPSLQSRIIVPPGSMKPGALFISAGYELSKHEALCIALQESGFRVIIAPWFSLELDLCGTRICRGVEIIGKGTYREICDWETFFPHFIAGSTDLRGEALNIYSKCVEISSNAILGWLPDAPLCELWAGKPFYIQSELVQSTVSKTPHPEEQDRSLTASRAYADIMSRLERRPLLVQLFAILDFSNLCGRLLDAQLSDGRCLSGPKSLICSENNAATFNSDKDEFKSVLDQVVAAIFVQAMESKVVATARHLSRFYLPIFIRIEMSPETGRIRCLVVEADIALNSENTLTSEKRNASLYARELWTRCTREPYLHIPSPSFSFGRDYAVSPVLQPISSVSERPMIRVQDLHKQINSFENRDRLASALTSQLEARNSLEIVEHPDDPMSYIISRDSLGSPRLNIRLSAGSDMSSLRHPLASVLPGLAREDHLVDTMPWRGAAFADLHPDLRGPVIADLDSDQSLLFYLGRVIANTRRDREPHGTPFEKIGARFVEPGVGRTCLVDFLGVEGRPELHDFSVTGIGLTPYSEGGFVDMGARPTGRAAITRAFHRKRCAQRLEEFGCRTTPVFAIIRLPDLTVSMPDGRESPAALIVRGFRMAIRVKQLDPVACFYHSHQHAAA